MIISTYVHTTFSEIDMLHDYYNFKKYNPPNDILINNICFQYFDVLFYFTNKLNIGTSFEFNSINLNDKKITFEDLEEKKVNNEIQNIKNIIMTDSSIKKKLISCDNIYKSIQNAIFDNPIISNDYKNIKDIIVQYTEFLNHLDTENIYGENMLKKALTFFERSETGRISVKDFRALVNKLGIFIDDEIIDAIDLKDGYIDRNTFIESIKVLLIRSCDSLILSKALSILNEESVEVSEKEYKNLVSYNGKNNVINVKKLMDEFIKN